ncbi:hypothetical protein SAMN05216412_101162 [Nitrosospira multiformis]|uniref:PXPV repeat-containing protein n=1 Tax=Nitrosospira multiformis TaxID=1231 RepID=A0A1H9YD54_9PROT|nr:hypothetical protein SAMN05216412_101162 [Nitrosospira multiformis]
MKKIMIALLPVAGLLIPALFAFLLSGIAQAEPPHLRDRETGKYLGNLSANPYDPDSVNNPYGRYGNPYSADSINNPYGQYGSRYSPDSANNPYATNPPAVYGDDNYRY